MRVQRAAASAAQPQPRPAGPAVLRLEQRSDPGTGGSASTDPHWGSGHLSVEVEVPASATTDLFVAGVAVRLVDLLHQAGLLDDQGPLRLVRPYAPGAMTCVLTPAVDQSVHAVRTALRRFPESWSPSGTGTGGVTLMDLSEAAVDPGAGWTPPGQVAAAIGAPRTRLAAVGETGVAVARRVLAEVTLAGLRLEQFGAAAVVLAELRSSVTGATDVAGVTDVLGPRS